MSFTQTIIKKAKQWDQGIFDQIQILNEAGNLNDDTVYTVLESYICNNIKNRYMDISPVKYFYDNYFHHLTQNICEKIIDIEFTYTLYFPIEDIPLRNEMRYKLTLYSLFQNNRKFLEETFNVNISCEFEKSSDVYKDTRDNFTSFIAEQFNTKEYPYKKYREHDCLFTIKNDQDVYQIACEYNEEHHCDEYDMNRKKSLKIPLTSMFVRKEGEYETTIESYIKSIFIEKIYKCCALSNNRKLLAKLCIFEKTTKSKYDEMSDQLNMLLNCLDNNYFSFLDLWGLLMLNKQRDQDEILQLFIENDIMYLEDEETDEDKISYYINDDGEYYIDNKQFKTFMKLLEGSDICNGYRQILGIYLESLEALLGASERLLEKEKESKIDTENISSFIQEIIYKPIKDMMEQKFQEYRLCKQYKELFEELSKKKHCSNRPLPYIKYDDNNNLRTSDLWIIREILGKNYNRVMKITIDKQSGSEKMIIMRNDKLNNNVEIKNAKIDYAELFNYHFLSKCK